MGGFAGQWEKQLGSLCQLALMSMQILLPAAAKEEGLGTYWHPTEVTQRKTAAIVVAKAREMMGW